MSFNGKESPAVWCGSGVPKAGIQESNTLSILGIAGVDESKQQPAVTEDGVYVDSRTGRRFKLNSLGQAKWSSEPIIKDQFVSRIPGLVKYDPPITAVFDLSDDDKLKEFNDLQAKTFPVEGPNVVIFNERDEFYEGKFIKLVKYSYVWYLVPEPK